MTRQRRARRLSLTGGRGTAGRSGLDLRELRLGAREVRLCLIHGGLLRTWIQRGEQVAARDVLAHRYVYVFDLAAEPEVDVRLSRRLEATAGRDARLHDATRRGDHALPRRGTSCRSQHEHGSDDGGHAEKSERELQCPGRVASLRWGAAAASVLTPRRHRAQRPLPSRRAGVLHLRTSRMRTSKVKRRARRLPHRCGRTHLVTQHPNLGGDRQQLRHVPTIAWRHGPCLTAHCELPESHGLAARSAAR